MNNKCKIYIQCMIILYLNKYEMIYNIINLKSSKISSVIFYQWIEFTQTWHYSNKLFEK